MTETTYTIHENMKKYNVLNCFKIESLLTLFRLIERCGEYWDKFAPIATASYGNFITDEPPSPKGASFLLHSFCVVTRQLRRLYKTVPALFKNIFCCIVISIYFFSTSWAYPIPVS